MDRPETVDENREVDLLQRMAISAEAPEDQLQELLNEVDAWLDSRADDTVCVQSGFSYNDHDSKSIFSASF